MRAALLVAAGLLGGCAVYGPPKSAAPAAEPRESWARVLSTQVDERGRVNFAALAGAPEDLERYVAWVYDSGPGNRPELFRTPQDVLAYHLNAYNALAMYAVIDSGIPESNSGFSKVSFFALRQVRVGGQGMSLRTYENDIIRKLGDPRVHFALNCMSLSCPRLPREPFVAANLEQQLEREARYFFSESRNLRVDDAAKTVWMSEILDFFPEDFLAHAPSLIAYVNRYLGKPVPADYKVRFTPYDWTIARQ